MAKSNFGRYLRYKLAKHRGAIIFFAVLNVASLLLPAILGDYCFRKTMQEVLRGESGLLYYTADEAFPLMFFAIPINVIVIIVMTIKSFKIYYKRNNIDTLGSLPLSYKERFWGDFLSVFLSEFVSFIPLYVVSLILLADMKRYADAILNSVYKLDLTMYTTAFSAVWLIQLLVYLGVFAVTAFVCSCCGKRSSAVLYTIILMAIFPGIIGVYAGYTLSYVVGMDSYAELTGLISMLPPLGPVVSVIMESQSDGYIPMSVRNYNLGENPYGLVVFLLIIAAFIAGAYFIGKRRRAERVGESFAFKSVYHVLTLSFMILLIGASFVGYSSLMEEGTGIQWVLLFTFLVYAALEISENKSFKGFWKTAVRYAAVFGVCIGFFTLVNGTNAFDMYKALPSAGSVKEIRLSGKYFYTPLHYNDYYKEYSVSEKESISEILSEHKDFLETGGYETGEEIRIVYALKDGREVTRLYSSNNPETEAAIKSICDNAKQLPDFDFGDLGIIDEPDLGNYTVSYHKTGSPVSYILREKVPELIEVLREDIKYNYSSTRGYALVHTENIGWIEFTKNGEGRNHNNDYYVYPTYTKTIEFLTDPSNLVAADVESGIEELYRFSYGDENLHLTVYVSKDDTSPAAKELISYIRERREDDDVINGVRVTGDTSFMYYAIDKENEQKALKAMLALFLEKHPVGND